MRATRAGLAAPGGAAAKLRNARGGPSLALARWPAAYSALVEEKVLCGALRPLTRWKAPGALEGSSSVAPESRRITCATPAEAAAFRPACGNAAARLSIFTDSAGRPATAAPPLGRPVSGKVAGTVVEGAGAAGCALPLPPQPASSTSSASSATSPVPSGTRSRAGAHARRRTAALGVMAPHCRILGLAARGPEEGPESARTGAQLPATLQALLHKENGERIARSPFFLLRRPSVQPPVMLLGRDSEDAPQALVVTEGRHIVEEVIPRDPEASACIR